MEKDDLVRFDFAIKSLLRHKKNFDILEGFIEVFLDKKCTIVDILESESNQVDSDDKFNRVDIKAKDDKGEIFIVEVQTTRYTYYLERVLYGVSKAVTEQMSSGDKFGEIHQVFSISIVYYDFGIGDDYFYECKSEFVGVHTHNVLQLNRREELSVAEIANGDTRKFKYKKITSAEIFPKYYLIRINSFREVIANAMDEWMDFLKNNSIKPDTTAPGLAQAREKLLYGQMTNEERARYDRHWMSLRNEEEAIEEAEIGGLEKGWNNGRAEGLAEGRAEGLAEGFAEGERKAKIETARTAKSMGLPIDQIAQLTGLTPSEITLL